MTTSKVILIAVRNHPNFRDGSLGSVSGTRDNFKTVGMMVDEIVSPVITQEITPKDFTFYIPQSTLNILFPQYHFKRPFACVVWSQTDSCMRKRHW